MSLSRGILGQPLETVIRNAAEGCAGQLADMDRPVSR